MVFKNHLIICMISRLKYLNGESSKSNEKIQEPLFKTSYIQNSTKNNLHCKALDENTGSCQQNNKSRSVANSQNEIMTLPDITTLKNEDFPGSSTNNLKIDIFMVFNILTTE